MVHLLMESERFIFLDAADGFIQVQLLKPKLENSVNAVQISTFNHLFLPNSKSALLDILKLIS